MNRAKTGTRVLSEVTEALAGLDATQAGTMLGNRVAYAETLGQGMGVLERGKGAWTDEIGGLLRDIEAALATG